MKHKHAELIKANFKRFNFNFETGVVRWADGRRKGFQVGNVDSHGYKQVKINGKMVLVHRIIYYVYYGTFPEQIDHIDRDRLNNSIANLRSATNMTNQHNVKIRKDNSSGFVGVHARHGRYQARIQCNSKRIHLGTFDTIEEAYKAYQKAKEQYHG